MTAYAFWNNKGGVGKSFLCFVAATEYAHAHPGADVYVIDLCPQANISETLLVKSNALRELIGEIPRRTVAGYLEARLNSPFQNLSDVSPFVTRAKDYNSNLPPNLLLVCGDNLLEILSEAIRQTSQLAIPVDAWKQVLSWIRDLTLALRKQSGNRDTLFILDCNPSFAIYTQLALVAAENVVVPFTADDSSRRAVENVVALLYGFPMDDAKIDAYARINFANRAKSEGVEPPKLHAFANNRVTLYKGTASSAFEAVSKTIKKTLDRLHKDHRQVFTTPKERPSERFIEIPDHHSACVVMTKTGTPLFKLKPGPKMIEGERVQLNPDPLERYRKALAAFVEYL
ncbi:MAG: ParA family protein [Caldilineaceae bacterium]|nr:ParA family protein [Caldilineaceae bacterium]